MDIVWKYAQTVRWMAAIGVTVYCRVGSTMVAPVLSAVLEAQNESRLRVARRVLYMRRSASKQCYLLEGGFYSRHIEHI